MRILRLDDVVERTGLSHSTLRRLEADGDFPRRRKISDRSVGWVEAEVEEWIESRPAVGTASRPSGDQVAQGRSVGADQEDHPKSR